MKKSDVDFVNSAAKIKNRVAVKRYYYDELPKQLKAMSFTVSDLSAVSTILGVQKSLENAISEGHSFKSWKKNLDQDVLKKLTDARLETIYRTNVNNVYNQSARYNSATSGVTPYLMYTAVGDERTRPEHLELDGVTKKADSAFWDKYTPPLGYNCVASYQKVSGEFSKGFRSSYKGDMVSIKLKSGKRIVGLTLNHPVATAHGFVAAKDLYAGDKVFLNSSEVQKFNASWNIDNKNLTPTASNVFKSMLLKALSFSQSTSFNFHGDIKFMNKEVDIVVVDRPLSSNSEGFEATEDLVFKLPDTTLMNRVFSFVRDLPFKIKFNAKVMKNASNVSTGKTKLLANARASVKFIFVESQDFFFDKLNVFSEKFLHRTTTRFNSRGMKPIVDRVSTDSELLAKFVNAKTFLVESDDIVNVEFYPYVGFVYDFESVHGLVIADGVVTSNCRCGVIPLSKEDAEEAGISRRSNKSFPEPAEGFGSSKMGDVLSSVGKDADRLIAKMEDSPLKDKFQDSQANIKSLVDIWFDKNKNIFK